MNLTGAIISQADELLPVPGSTSTSFISTYGYGGTMFFPIIFCRSSVEAAMYGNSGTMFFHIIFCRSSVERL